MAICTIDVTDLNILNYGDDTSADIITLQLYTRHQEEDFRFIVRKTIFTADILKHRDSTKAVKASDNSSSFITAKKI
ncbi:hypothetical protein TNCV_3029441 [Trichonephila clavipes]|nr:hypothetical protein TNCV_3029441 [Trichonephila clavipes]